MKSMAIDERESEARELIDSISTPPIVDLKCKLCNFKRFPNADEDWKA